MKRVTMYIYETHAHTSLVSACAVSTPAQQVRAYKDHGYAGIIITDHFVNGHGYSHPSDHMPWDEKVRFFCSGYNEAKKEGDKIGLQVFFGWEYTINGRDFLTYGLDEEYLLAHQEVEQRTITIQAYSELIHKAGGFLAQAHPFREAWWIDPAPPLPTSLLPSSLLDAVEVYNASMRPHENQKAREYAIKHGLPMQFGTDSHDAETTKIAGVVLQKKAKTIFDIIEAIKNGVDFYTNG